MTRLRALALGLCLTWLAGCGGAGGAATSDPAAGVYAGKIVDPDGYPIAGALVSVDGIEANSPTDATGAFLVSDPSLSQTGAAVVRGKAGVSAAVTGPEITVLAPGFTPFVGTLDVAAGDVPLVEVVREGLEPDLTVSAPSGARVLVVPAGCSSPVARVEGYVDLVERESFLLDIVALIDVSGSTARDAFDVNGDGVPESVLEAEREAVRCFLNGLDLGRTRVALATFSDRATEFVSFTSSLATLLAALDSVGVSDGGTNYEAAFTKAAELIETRVEADLADALEAGAPEEGEEATPPERRRAVVLLSDGIPTTHGVPKDPDDSNLTQSADDRAASIAAAEDLGERTGAEIYGYAVVTASAEDQRFTTLPHCIAVCGGGRHARVSTAAQLDSELCGESFVSVTEVEIENLTLGSAPVEARLSAGGHFSQTVAVDFASDGSVVENTLRVTARSFADHLASPPTVSQDVEIRVVTEAGAAAMGFDEVTQAEKAPQSVGELAYLSRPTGGRIRDGILHGFLVGAATAEFEDAIEVYGVETFSTHDPGGSGGETFEVVVDMIFSEACYRSDVGYITYDPADPPATAKEALTDPAYEATTLFNSWDDFPGRTCNHGSIAAGEARYRIDLPAGRRLAFFLIPNGKLAAYQAFPCSCKSPLFTVDSLNPGGFDQVLTFLSEDGRTESGASRTRVTDGPLLILAFEDISIASRRSDQDFSDVVMAISAGVRPVLEGLTCDDP